VRLPSSRRPCPGGPGIARADLLVLNKTDLAPHVGVDVELMLADATAAREGGPVICLSRHDAASIADLTAWVTSMTARVRDGHHVPLDPGPVAPHSHAHTTPATTTSTGTNGLADHDDRAHPRPWRPDSVRPRRRRAGAALGPPHP
jgi:hypothetical protein